MVVGVDVVDVQVRPAEHDHLPEAHVPGENDEAEKQRDAAKADLRDKQHAALVEPVDEQPSVGTEQQDRSIARCGCQSEQESRMGLDKGAAMPGRSATVSTQVPIGPAALDQRRIEDEGLRNGDERLLSLDGASPLV